MAYQNKKILSKMIIYIFSICLLSLVVNCTVVDPTDLFARKPNPIVNVIVLLVANMHRKEPNADSVARDTILVVKNKYLGLFSYFHTVKK